MFPYNHQTPEENAAVNEEIVKLSKRIGRGLLFPFRWTCGQLKRFRRFMVEGVGFIPDDYVYVPSMGHGGLGGYYPRISTHPDLQCTNPGCGCGDQRERWDLPPSRPIVIEGMPVTPELELLFGYWGKVTGVRTDFDGNIIAHYGETLEITFLAVVDVKGVTREGL